MPDDLCICKMNLVHTKEFHRRGGRIAGQINVESGHWKRLLVDPRRSNWARKGGLATSAKFPKRQHTLIPWTPEMRQAQLARVREKNLRDPEWHRKGGRAGSHENKAKAGRSGSRENKQKAWRKAVESGKLFNRKNADTKPELAVKAKLDELVAMKAISGYEHPYNLNNKFFVDFYVPGFNTMIEVDGCYWHKCECRGFVGGRARDRRRDAYIRACGYKLEIIREHELYKLSKASASL